MKIVIYDEVVSLMILIHPSLEFISLPNTITLPYSIRILAAPSKKSLSYISICAGNTSDSKQRIIVQGVLVGGERDLLLYLFIL